MGKSDNPLAFRWFKTHHQRNGADKLMQRIWQECSDRGAMQVRAISATEDTMDTHVTYVARGGNSHDVGRRYFDEWDDDEGAVDCYTTAVMVDLDALGLTHVDRRVASDVLHQAILDAREALLPYVNEPRPRQEPRPKVEFLPYDLPEPPDEEVRSFTQGKRRYDVTYAKSDERRFGRQWDEVRMVARSVVDDTGCEHSLHTGLCLAGFVESSYWVNAPKVC